MRRLVILVLALLIITSSLAIISMNPSEEVDVLQPLREDELYCILTTEMNPREELTSFLVTEDKLILYYDESGLVNIYTLDGIFLYGLQIKTIRNGLGDIAFAKGVLYVKARGNRMYVLDEERNIHSFVRSDDPVEFAQIESVMDEEKAHSIGNTTFYYLAESNTIAKTVANGPMEPVISMSQSNNNMTVAIILLLVIAAFVHYLRFNFTG